MLIDSKAAVAAETLRPGTSEMPLPTGDVIHGLNSTTVASMADLREGLEKTAPGDAVVLLIERYGQLVYESFVMQKISLLCRILVNIANHTRTRCFSSPN